MVWKTGTVAEMQLLFIWKYQSSSNAVTFYRFFKSPGRAVKLASLSSLWRFRIIPLSLGITGNQWQNTKTVHEIFQRWPTSSLIKITLSFAMDFSGRVRPILCANEIAFQKATPVVVSNHSQLWVAMWFQRYWGACQHCETFILTLDGSNLHLEGCGRRHKAHRGLSSEASACAFASAVSLFGSGGGKA